MSADETQRAMELLLLIDKWLNKRIGRSRISSIVIFCPVCEVGWKGREKHAEDCWVEKFRNFGIEKTDLLKIGKDE